MPPLPRGEFHLLLQNNYDILQAATFAVSITFMLPKFWKRDGNVRGSIPGRSGLPFSVKQWLFSTLQIVPKDAMILSKNEDCDKSGLHNDSQGQVEEEKLDSYDIHIYAASKGEIEDGIKKEGSFEMEQFEMIEFEDDLCEQGPTIGEKVAA
ncbi:SAM dependent carboxyl methyltransferase [Dillenia turbinata]|uniref:SAM dependent carboxyl methyltransferase n=1 Tax=Dillenia turbinata TaxID=194707 RepID=A0AAN8V7I2_9MAGN